jgi:diguanylate cyclase (GGDEF)-like protein/PAS domain S-box-containing protein
MNRKPIGTVLLIEDNPGDERLLREMFKEQGLQNTAFTYVQSMSDAESHLAQHAVDIILLDLGLPDAQGLEAVRRVRAAARHTPLVVLTGMDDEVMAAHALQEGVQDYLVKGQIEARALPRAMRYAVERKAMEENLFAEQERAQVTLNSIGDAVISTDSAGSITFLNPAAEELTGWPQHEAAGRPLADVYRPRDAATVELIPNRMHAATRGVHLSSVGTLVRRDGSDIPIEDSVARIHDREGRTRGAVVVFRDVSVRALALKMTHSAQHDFLTGLPNRMLLSDRIGQAIAMASRHSSQLAVLFLDLDGFKRINDTLGHLTGDKLLQSVARRLAACVRGSDTVSRQGGDEFVVLLSELKHPEDVAALARKILRAVAQPHCVGEHALHVNTSIGVSIYPDDGLDAETLIKNADTAMYQAKEQGRGRYQFFKPAMNLRVAERQAIEKSLRRAMERQELALSYQPKIKLGTGAICGAQASIRWVHPSRGLLCPSQFLPIAEECGLILPIGKWIMREACRQARAWVDAGLPAITMAVNVCVRELQNEHFAEEVLAILAETRFDPGSLELEVTENVLMKGAESGAAILQALRAGGVRVAIDQFGTGYSSFASLRAFPVDALKIDRSFVRLLTDGGNDSGIVTAMIGMARSLRLRVAAQGVDTPAQLAFLQIEHCDEAQGDYFSAPLPAQQFAALLAGGPQFPSLAVDGNN